MSLRRPPIDPWIAIGTLVFAAFGLPSVAMAWGPSVHLWIGDVLLQTAAASLPLVSTLLRPHACAFLYGCLAPDFFVGKGSIGHDMHCHNWEVGKRLLERAPSEHERAFALGYMTHLAADVIGHNYFVPNNLYRLFGAHRFGHVFFELHADNLIDHEYVNFADALVGASNASCDALLKAVVPLGRVPFGAKKVLFTTWITLHNRSAMKRLLHRVRPFSESLLRHDDVRDMIELSLALAQEMLIDPSVPLLGRYDPIGADNIRMAMDIRRTNKRSGAYARDHCAFPIPEALHAVRARLRMLDIESYAGPLDWRDSGAALLSGPLGVAALP